MALLEPKNDPKLYASFLKRPPEPDPPLPEVTEEEKKSLERQKAARRPRKRATKSSA